jgi:hypothetical protein
VSGRLQDVRRHALERLFSLPWRRRICRSPQWATTKATWRLPGFQSGGTPDSTKYLGSRTPKPLLADAKGRRRSGSLGCCSTVGSCGVEPVPGRLFDPAQPDCPLRRTGVGAAPRPCSDPVRDESAGRALVRPMRSAPRSGLIVRRQDPARKGNCDHETDDHHDRLRRRSDAGTRRAGRGPQEADSSAADGSRRCSTTRP